MCCCAFYSYCNIDALWFTSTKQIADFVSDVECISPMRISELAWLALLSVHKQKWSQLRAICVTGYHAVVVTNSRKYIDTFWRYHGLRVFVFIFWCRLSCLRRLGRLHNSVTLGQSLTPLFPTGCGWVELLLTIKHVVVRRFVPRTTEV